MSIRLFMSAPPATAISDRLQFDAALRGNLQNQCVDQVIVLAPDTDSEPGTPTVRPGHPKLQYIASSLANSQLIGSLFAEANRCLTSPDDISVICQAGLVFDALLAAAARLRNASVCFALSAAADPGDFETVGRAAADIVAWLFRGRIRPLLTAPLSIVGAGTPRELLADLRRADYYVCNPSQTIQCRRIEPAVSPARQETAAQYRDRALLPTTLQQSGVDLLPPSEQGVIAFSLYGAAGRYHHGALENAKAIKWIYPDWLARFYVDTSVPDEFLRQLHALNAEIIVMPDSRDKQGMFWRFLAADDPAFSRWMVRDADSRLTYRERRAVDEWIASGRPFHVMRDHPRHNMAIVGCAFGGVRGALPSMAGLIGSWRAAGQPFGSYGDDEKFLEAIVWPLIKDVALVHDSTAAEHEGNIHPFPSPYENFRFVGERISADDHASYPERQALIQSQLRSARRTNDRT